MSTITVWMFVVNVHYSAGIQFSPAAATFEDCNRIRSAAIEVSRRGSEYAERMSQCFKVTTPASAARGPA